jgi:hypothetical protein
MKFKAANVPMISAALLPAVTAAPTTTQFMSLPSPTGLISIDNVPSPSKASVTNPVGILSNAFNCFFEGLFQFFL